MAHLHQVLADQVREWRASGLQHDAYPAVAEILDFQRLPASAPGARRERRFLREAQIEALTTYWYLRLVAKTPHVMALYRGGISSKYRPPEGFWHHQQRSL
jgi:type III restriction enzyme